MSNYVEIPVFPVSVYPWQCANCGTPLQMPLSGHRPSPCPICSSTRYKLRAEVGDQS